MTSIYAFGTWKSMASRILKETLVVVFFCCCFLLLFFFLMWQVKTSLLRKCQWYGVITYTEIKIWREGFWRMQARIINKNLQSQLKTVRMHSKKKEKIYKMIARSPSNYILILDLLWFHDSLENLPFLMEKHSYAHSKKCYWYLWLLTASLLKLKKAVFYA